MSVGDFLLIKIYLHIVWLARPILSLSFTILSFVCKVDGLATLTAFPVVKVIDVLDKHYMKYSLAIRYGVDITCDHK